MCSLIVDTRERHVTRHQKELENIKYQVKQITVGDYIVLSSTGSILAVIERKSLDDYSASIKDGRHNNKSKLIDLRTATGCRIVYIIEGPEFPKPTDYFGNISYKHIESSIFHLMIRDGIVVIRTRDSLDTAKMLSRFIYSMDTLEQKMDGFDIQENIQTVNLPNMDMPINPMDLLTAKHEKTEHEIVQEMWSCFPGISIETTSEYMKHWSISDIVCNKISYEQVSAFKLASGRKISKKVIASLTNVPKLLQIRLLKTIPGISHNTAVELICNTTLAQILTYNKECISMRVVGKNSRRFGDKNASKLLKYFNYKYLEIHNEINKDINNEVNEVKNEIICEITDEASADELDIDDLIDSINI